MSKDRLKPNFARPNGNGDFEKVVDVMSAMLMAAGQHQNDTGADPAVHTSMTISAAGLLAGYLTGAWIVAGLALDRDQKQIRDALAVTFRQGVKMGKANAVMAMPPMGSA